MGKKYFQFGLFAMGLAVVSMAILSNASGPGGDRTGAPGSSGNCSGCHGGTANLGGDLVLTAVDVASTKTVTSYEAGKKYTIGIKMGGTSLRKGFQATVLDAANKAIGTVSNVGTGATSYTSGTRTIVGHNTPGLGVWYFDWTAPATAAGDITIHASGVVSNSNNNNSGDQVIKNSLTLTAPVSSVMNSSNVDINLYPNPSNDKVNISEALKNVKVISVDGKVAMTVDSATQTLDIKGLLNGQYFIVAENTQGQVVHLTFVKN
jgi:hypothetical protein